MVRFYLLGCFSIICLFRYFERQCMTRNWLEIKSSVSFLLRWWFLTSLRLTLSSDDVDSVLATISTGSIGINQTSTLAVAADGWRIISTLCFLQTNIGFMFLQIATGNKHWFFHWLGATWISVLFLFHFCVIRVCCSRCVNICLTLSNNPFLKWWMQLRVCVCSCFFWWLY